MMYEHVTNTLLFVLEDMVLPIKVNMEHVSDRYFLRPMAMVSAAANALLIRHTKDRPLPQWHCTV